LNDLLGVFVSYGELIKNVPEDNPLLTDQLKETSIGVRLDFRETIIFKSQGSYMRGSYGTQAPRNMASDWFILSSRLTWSF
jgi:hypothetical protein